MDRARVDRTCSFDTRSFLIGQLYNSIYCHLIRAEGPKTGTLRAGRPVWATGVACVRSEQRERVFHCNVPALQFMAASFCLKRILSQVAKDSDGCHDYVPERSGGGPQRR